MSSTILEWSMGRKVDLLNDSIIVLAFDFSVCMEIQGPVRSEGQTGVN